MVRGHVESRSATVANAVKGCKSREMAVASNPRFKRVAVNAFLVTAGIGLIFLLFWNKPQVHLRCRFTQSLSATNPASHRGLVDQIEGHIGNGPDDKGMAEFDGLASGGERSGGRVSGAVFLDKAGSVSGLFLTVEHADFRGNDLRIATLNRDGKLDANSSEAFQYFRDQLDKRSYPVRYSCTENR